MLYLLFRDFPYPEFALENVNQAEKRVREFKANMKAVKAAGQLQEDKKGATEAAEVNAERMCESPEELNRRKALRFIQEHGGIETWRNLFNDLDGHVDGKGKAPEPGQGREVGVFDASVGAAGSA